MFFFVSLLLLAGAGFLAVRADKSPAYSRRFEIAAGLMLIAALSLIGWRLNDRR